MLEKAIDTPIVQDDNKLKIIHTLFGEKKTFEEQQEFQRRVYREAKGSLEKPWTKNNLHFTLEEHNRDFLLENGANEKNVILIKELPKKLPRHFSFFYRIFIFLKATEMFPDNSFLSLDYDCELIREFNKKDINNILENGERDIQCPPVMYRRKNFTSIDRSRQRYGFQGCLVYWRDHSIIRKWFETYLKNPNINNDEPVLLMTLEGLYGKLSIKDLFSFDTKIINTRRRKRMAEFYNNEDYKDAYFWHG